MLSPIKSTGSNDSYFKQFAFQMVEKTMWSDGKGTGIRIRSLGFEFILANYQADKFSFET